MTVFLKKGFTTSCLTCKCHFLRVWGPFPSAGSRGRLGKKALNWVFSLCQGSLSFARGEGFDFEHPLVMSRLPRASFLTQWFSRALTLGWHCSCIFCSAAHLVQMLFFPLVSQCVVLSGDTQRSSLPDLKNSGKLKAPFISCKLGSHWSLLHSGCGLMS